MGLEDNVNKIKKSPGMTQFASSLKVEEGILEVDWGILAEMQFHDEELSIFYSKLTELGILSSKQYGNYVLAKGHSILDPVGGFHGPLYFTRLRDVRAYDKAFNKNALFGRKILKCVEEITATRSH